MTLAQRLAPIVFISVLLAACGSDGDPESDATATSPAACVGMVDLRGSSRPLETAEGLSAYANAQRELLERLSREMPDRPLQAGVNLKRLVKQDKLDALISDLGLQWLNIYWDSPSGEHGAISRSVGPQSLNGLNRGAAAYYLTIEPLPVSELKELDEQEIVYLVDVGRIDEFDEAAASSTCVRFALPDPLWFVAQDLKVLLE